MTGEVVPKQCVFIDKARAGGGASSIPPPPVIPSNTNSTRANSRRNRVFVYRDFLLSTFPQLLTTSCKNVLDVAGGRGDLSWLLHNIDGINSIIADPRLPNHKSLIKSTTFLLDHPEEAAVRAVEGLPTHQPLATLLPRLMDRCDGNLSSPLHLRMHVDNNLVEALIKVCSNTHSKEEEEEEEDKIMIWNEYWQKEKYRIESNKTVYGGTAPQTKTQNNNQDDASPSNRPQQITDARAALNTFKSLDYITGFHPDQATEATIDLALFLKVPFSIVPCCVFPSEFPNRQLDGMRVKSHSQLIDYLCMKHEKIRKGILQFVDDEKGTAKNVVLYMLKEDYD